MSARGGAQETGSLAERLAEELEQEILRQRMDAGARFGLRSTLIERYAVSANVMNEALRILRDRGVVTVRPGPQGGVFVAHPPPQLRLGAIDLWFRGLHVDPVELCHAAEASQREFVLEEAPGAFRKAFTLGQFAESVARVDPSLTGAALVTAVGHRRAGAIDAHDIQDPYRRGRSAAELSADQIDALLQAVLPRLSPSSETGSNR